MDNEFADRAIFQMRLRKLFDAHNNSVKALKEFNHIFYKYKTSRYYPHIYNLTKNAINNKQHLTKMMSIRRKEENNDIPHQVKTGCLDG